MNVEYPVAYEVGDVVFTCIGNLLFRQVSAASACWSNHVGIIIGHDGEDYIVAESKVPLSQTTTLSKFIARSVDGRYGIRRLNGGLSEAQKRAIVEQVPERLNVLYHTGFKYESSRQFCSKFVFDIYRDALSVPIGKVETFNTLLSNNPDARLQFWHLWFMGSIPWERKTVTPASLWFFPSLFSVFNSHPEAAENRPDWYQR
ncbi:YebB family permuted papain-like enzyme [Budvicia diplopodorum]|uniref:YebB family permuted papain-like enzyme n=1 Tax=Budvicia diplopodorum TaxID=1119056 RepID=UPI001359D071|nr:YebB family permuted papain-like enzyme [Budvicia diplopodorum]